MSAREKVAAAIESAIHDAAHPFTPYATVADAAIAAHLEALKTRRWYIAGYRNQLGTVSTMGAENAWLPAVEEVVAELNRDDPENEFFVAYQDVPAWQRLEASQ